MTTWGYVGKYISVFLFVGYVENIEVQKATLTNKDTGTLKMSPTLKDSKNF